MHISGFGVVGVLAGGPSSEREISLRSGRAVHDALRSRGVNSIFMDVGEDICDIITKTGIDVAFIALHGRFGEDGTVQSALEKAGIPYTGSGPAASRLALDKIASKDVFESRGIPVARHVVLRDGIKDAKLLSKIDPPVVVKPQWEGSSIGLSVVRDRNALSAAVDTAFKYGPNLIIEQYVHGRELTVGILDEEPLPVIEIVTENGTYDYQAKYNSPNTRYLVPAPIPPAVSAKARALGLMAHNALGCRSMSRVDLMMDRDHALFVLEVNTIPGMTERSLLPKAAAAAGIKFEDLCIKLISNAYSSKGWHETAKKAQGR